MRLRRINILALTALTTTGLGCGGLGGGGVSSPGKGGGTMAIVFSTAPITAVSLDAGDPALTTTFEVGDPIYARFYTTDGRAIQDHQSSPGNPVAFVMLYHDIDGRDYDDSYALSLDGGGLQQSYADIDVFVEGAPRQALDGQISARFLEFVSLSCGQGKESVQISVDMRSWGKSSFTVRCSQDGLARAEAMSRSSGVAAIDDVRMRAAVMQDEALEQQMAKVAENTPDRTGGGTALRVVIVEPDWTIEYSEAGQITGRRLYADVAFQRSDDEVCYVENVRFTQNYDGKGYVNLHVPTAGSGTQRILCRNVGE